MNVVIFMIQVVAAVVALTVGITSWDVPKLAMSCVGLLILAVAADNLLGGIFPELTVPILLFGALVALIRIIGVALRSRDIAAQIQNTKSASR